MKREDPINLNMEKYRNATGGSGVSAYQTGSDFIIVKFSGNVRSYRYSYRGASQRHVEQMKLLARRGSGLNCYINQYVKNLYDK